MRPTEKIDLSLGRANSFLLFSAAMETKDICLDVGCVVMFW
jgi:hypothetical protein